MVIVSLKTFDMYRMFFKVYINEQNPGEGVIYFFLTEIIFIYPNPVLVVLLRLFRFKRFSRVIKIAAYVYSSFNIPQQLFF